MPRPDAQLLSNLLRRVRNRLRSWPRRGRSRSPQHRPAVLDEATRGLQESIVGTEKVFHRLSDTFVPLNDRISTLLKQCDELVAIATGRREGMTLFQEAVQVLHSPIEYVDFCITRHARLLELFARTEKRTQAMLNFQRQMKALLAPLTYIEVLIKIESATLDNEQRDTFLTVVAEIERLHTLVNETFEKNTTLLAQTYATIARVRTKLEVDFERHARNTGERRSQIESAITSLDEQLSSGSDREVKIQVFSRELSQQVNRIVVSIQTQDIASQKCGHIIDALTELKVDPTGLVHVLKLQLSQLAQVQSDITTAEKQIAESIGLIDRKASEIDHNALTLDEFTQMTASADGMVQQLLDAFAGVRDIIDSTLVLTQEAHDAALPASNIASSLSTTLGDLSINMRLIALNAQVRALQIDQGTGLEILAARTAAISGEISRISDQVAQDLTELRDDTQECLTMLDEFRTRGTAQQSELTLNSPGSEQRLHRLRDQALAVMATIGETATAIHTSAQSSHEDMAPLAGWRDSLARIHGLLQDHVAALGHESDSPPCERTKRKLEQHATRYTMHSERQVHATGKDGSPDEGSLTGQAAEGADFEFFVDVPAAKASPATVQAPSAFNVPEDNKPVGVAQPSASQNLGANVDLF